MGRWNPIKKITQVAQSVANTASGAANSVAAGVVHAVNEAKDELIDKPTAAVVAGANHATEELKQEIENQLKEKYNHVVHYTYDKIIEEAEKEFDPFMESLTTSQDWKQKCAAIILKPYKSQIFDMFKGELRAKILAKIEK